MLPRVATLVAEQGAAYRVHLDSYLHRHQRRSLAVVADNDTASQCRRMVRRYSSVLPIGIQNDIFPT